MRPAEHSKSHIALDGVPQSAARLGPWQSSLLERPCGCSLQSRHFGLSRLIASSYGPACPGREYLAATNEQPGDLSLLLLFLISSTATRWKREDSRGRGALVAERCIPAGTSPAEALFAS